MRIVRLMAWAAHRLRAGWLMLPASGRRNCGISQGGAGDDDGHGFLVVVASVLVAVTMTVARR